MGRCQESGMPHPETVQGTSYASPRVAAVMAELHGRNPDLSSRQIENLMMQNLTYELPQSGGSIDVLDLREASQTLW